MDSVLRGAVIYLVLLVVFRLAGRRTLAETTTFDFVLLLIISEATQQALLGDDFSITTGLLVILTLIMMDIGISALQQRMPAVSRWVSGVPVVLVVDGEPLRPMMRQARVDIDDILEAARQLRGLERMDQIKFAVLERDGAISIIPKRDVPGRDPGD